MKIPFFVQEFTDEMEAAAVATLRNESFVGGESVSKISTTYGDYLNSTVFLNKFILSKYPQIILYKQGALKKIESN